MFHPDLLNADFVSAQYAVRGELYLKGEELRKAGKEIIFTNGMLPLSLMSSCCQTCYRNFALWLTAGYVAVGNPQVMGQKPLKFNRQVLLVPVFSSATNAFRL